MDRAFYHYKMSIFFSYNNFYLRVSPDFSIAAPALSLSASIWVALSLDCLPWTLDYWFESSVLFWHWHLSSSYFQFNFVFESKVCLLYWENIFLCVCCETWWYPTDLWGSANFLHSFFLLFLRLNNLNCYLSSGLAYSLFCHLTSALKTF